MNFALNETVLCYFGYLKVNGVCFLHGLLFRLFLSLLFHYKFRSYRKSQVLSKKAQTLLLSQRKLIRTPYYTESVFHSPLLCIHSPLCRVILLCCTRDSFKIASRGILCQASTRTESLAFKLVEHFWMDALSITIVHTPLWLCQKVWFSFFIRAACSAHMTSKAIKQSWHK